MEQEQLVEKLKKRLKRKILIITGSREIDREELVNKIIEGTDYHTYTPPKKTTFLDYITFIRKHSIEQCDYDTTRKLDYWYNLHFHEKWLKNNECLIVIKEPNFIPYQKLHWIRGFIELTDDHKKGQKFPHLILADDNIADLTYNIFASPFDGYRQVSNGRTPELIIKQNIDIIDLSVLFPINH